MKKLLILFGLILITSSALAMGQAPSSTGDNAFTLSDLNGNQVSLDSFKGKKTVLVTFFTTWCPSCQDEMPQLESISQKYRSKDLQVIGVGIKETKESLVTFAKEKGVTFPILLDEKGRVATAFGVRYIPNMFIYDKSGKQVFHANYMKSEDLENVLNKIVK